MGASHWFEGATRARKPLSLSICLLIAACVAVGQDSKRVDQDDALERSRIFAWPTTGKNDLNLWLKNNERLLNQGDVCTLDRSWSDEKTRISTGNWEIESFLVTPEDEEVKRIIHDPESGLGIRVGVQYEPIKPGMSGIRVALAFEGAAQDVFDEISRSEAETIRAKEWHSVATTKQVQNGGRLYRFHLDCENGKTAFSFLRRRK